MNVPGLRSAVLVASACVALVEAASAAPTPDQGLLARYQPATQFDPLESFRPGIVQSFITDASLEQLVSPGIWSVVDADPAPGALPGLDAGVFRLNQESRTPSAPLGGLACYAAAAGGGPGVYGRVAREDDRIVLQYWYFYYDDVYSYRYPPSDFVWQAHEGDWEVVNVVLSGDEDPLFVGYSQHCSGERRSWIDTTRLDETHPLVHVAIGSHANYFTAGVHPIDTACIPPAAFAFFFRSGLPLPVDYAFDGEIAGPPGIDGPATPIHPIGDTGAPWLSFAGFWGELQYFHAPPPVGTVALGTSPVGPAFHRVWVDPLGTMSTWNDG
jgi:hypothetical protein